jgi:hypothetical protein
MLDHFPMPLYGRATRRHILKWIREEIAKYLYQPGAKYKDMQAQYETQDATWKSEGGFDEFWLPLISNYLSRAQDAFASNQPARGQQALAKCTTVLIDCMESSIREYGPLPKPGLPSGTIEPWYDPSYIQHTDPDRPNYVG